MVDRFKYVEIDKDVIGVMITGSVRLFVPDMKTGIILCDSGFLPNMIVETGKDYLLDEIFNIGKWNEGLGIRAVAVGRSTDTVSGVAGPSEGVDIPIGGAWNGVDEDDWRLADEMARSSILSASRIDQEVTVLSQFVDGQFSDPSPVKIREVGLFLHPTDPPLNNPQTNPTQKPYAMFSRRIYFGYDDPADPQYYVDRPFLKVKDGNPLMMEYRIELG